MKLVYSLFISLGVVDAFSILAGIGITTRSRVSSARTTAFTQRWSSVADDEKEADIKGSESTTSSLEISQSKLKEIDDSPMFLTSESNQKDNVLSPEKAINIAKRFLLSSQGIGGDANLLSDSFVFGGPVVGPLGKSQFVDATSQVDFQAGFPDWKSQFYNFQVDVFDPERVWYMAKGEGTNTGPFPTPELEATYKTVINPPQICSLTIDSKTGLIKKYTIGYVADRNIGNTGGLGGLYGIMYAIGRPLPFPEAMPWKPSLPYLLFQKIGGAFRKLQN